MQKMVEEIRIAITVGKESTDGTLKMKPELFNDYVGSSHAIFCFETKPVDAVFT